MTAYINSFRYAMHAEGYVAESQITNTFRLLQSFTGIYHPSNQQVVYFVFLFQDKNK